jgi:hypothetical protein
VAYAASELEPHIEDLDRPAAVALVEGGAQHRAAGGAHVDEVADEAAGRWLPWLTRIAAAGR